MSGIARIAQHWQDRLNKAKGRPTSQDEEDAKKTIGTLIQGRYIKPEIVPKILMDINQGKRATFLLQDIGTSPESYFVDQRSSLEIKRSLESKESRHLAKLLETAIARDPGKQAQADYLNTKMPGSVPVSANNLPVQLGGMQQGQNQLMPQLQLAEGANIQRTAPRQQMTSNMAFSPNLQFRPQYMATPQERNLQQALESGVSLDDIKKLGELAPGVLPQKESNFIDEMIKKSNARKAQEEAKQAGIKTSKAQRELDIATGKIKEKLTPEQEWKNTQYKYMLRAFPGLNEATKNSIAFKGIPNPTVEQQKQSKEAEKQLRLEQNKADKEYKSQVSNIYKTAVNIASRDKDKKVNEDQLTDEHLAKAISVLSQDPFRGRDYQKFLDIVQEETTMVDDFLWFDKKVPASLIREKIEYLNPRIIMKQIEETQSLPIQRKPLTGIFK